MYFYFPTSCYLIQLWFVIFEVWKCPFTVDWTSSISHPELGVCGSAVLFQIYFQASNYKNKLFVGRAFWNRIPINIIFYYLYPILYLIILFKRLCEQRTHKLPFQIVKRTRKFSKRRPWQLVLFTFSEYFIIFKCRLASRSMLSNVSRQVYSQLKITVGLQIGPVRWQIVLYEASSLPSSQRIICIKVDKITLGAKSSFHPWHHFNKISLQNHFCN